MKKNKFLLALFSISITFFGEFFSSYAALEDYTTLRDIDRGTFNEYRYYMVKEYFKLKEQFELNGRIDKTVASNLLKYAKIGYNYLPDNLINQNLYNDLSIAIKKGYDAPNSEVNYEEIVKKLNNYLEKTNIGAIKGSIEAFPSTGNAPLTVTLRGKVTDPTGTVIPKSNYIWWFDDAGTKRIIGKGPSINYTFKDEGNFSVFLDVKSNHKNSAGYSDVLPFSTRTVIEVKEKVASIVINVNSRSLKEADELKFTPEEASYGLIFDATSSIPTGGAKFIKTEWDFGNGIEKKYDGAPRIERVIYSKEGSYPVFLRLHTNEGKTIDRKFIISVRKPIASIQSNIENGYVGDRFVFSAISPINEKNLSFFWNIVDIGNDKIITSKNGNVISHIFNEKGRYNIQLKVKDAAGNEDVDTKIIHVNSRPPVAEFTYSFPDKSKPNRVLLDGTRSFDPDFSDDGKLKYVWTINGEIVELDQLDDKGAIGYYSFNSIGHQSVSLEVIDPDQMSSVKQIKVPVTSTLSVEFFAFPRVIQRGGFVKLVAISPNARVFEWDFGDGNKKSSTSNKIEHVYNKSGTYNVKLTVKDLDGNVNETSKTVYVGDSNSPLAVIGVDFGLNESPEFNKEACGSGAYLVDRVKVVNFRGSESINVDGQNSGLSYSWKIGNKLVSTMDATHKFDELGCFPIKLTVKSVKTGAIDVAETWVKVVNIKPSLTSLDIKIQDDRKDPVIISVSALGAKDADGVIQSYLWYYYTDSDTDPQDFRITSVPSTTFVIPRIAGNYYFVVVMKDNNDERYSSEELGSNKYMITLSGDNANVPLIDLKVDRNNVLIGEEIAFTVNAKNILGQDITSKTKFAWDFDGDGFYDKETDVGNITHRYENSGTFYAKVRAKHKGMTNVRTVEINVANILEPKFDYISLGDTYLFFNTSAGKFDKVIWDLGDGNTVNDKNYFSYTYKDGKKAHDVSIKIIDGTKVRSKSQKVFFNVKNALSIKNAKDLKLFSYPKEENGKITLRNSQEKVYLYLNRLDNVKKYAIDFDIDLDSDLNGGKDDDVDNKSDPSYENAGLLEVGLSDKRTQKLRIFLLDSNGNIVDSRDLKIEKEYIEEEVDLGKIVFDGVTDDEKAKIEKLKSYVKDLPQEHRLKAMKYVQRLQEEWFYPSEKTKIILEFESFIDSTGVPTASEIINLLESFLVQGQEDQSVRNMSYNVIKNLIPKELVGYEEIIANLDKIKSNPDKLEENKVLGKEILEMIKDTSLIKNEDKITIKTQLQVLIYGSVDKIPKEVVKEVKKESSSGDKVISLLSGVIKIIGILFLLVFLLIFGFFIWYKVSNKNKNLGLQDFIIEKTSGRKTQANNDILGNITLTKDIETKIKDAETKVESEGLITRQVKLPGTELQGKSNSSLAFETGSSSGVEEKQATVEEKQKETKVEEEKIPDWLKGALGEDKSPKENQESKKEPEETEKDLLATVEEKQKETKVEEEKIPDWLKGVLGSDKLVKEEQNGKSTREEDLLVEKKPKKARTAKKTKENYESLDNLSSDSQVNRLSSTKSSTASSNLKENKNDFWTLDVDGLSSNDGK